MSEAPERIYARFATTGPGINIRKWSTAEFSEAEAIYLRSDTAIPKAEAEAMVAAAFDSIRNKLIPAMRGDAAACATTHPEISEDRLDYAEMLEEILSLAAKAPARAAFEQVVREAVEAEREQVILWARQEQRFCAYHKDKAGEIAYARLAERLERAAAIRAPQETRE